MKPRVAPHVAELPKSGIRKFFDIVAQSKDIVSLGVGEPDFDTPWHISRAAVTCLENGGTHYTSNLGTPALRQAICRYLERRFDARFDWTKEVLATVGVSEAIDLAIRALCSPGDEVLYHEPCFVSYAATIRLAHATPVAVETRVEDEFRLTVDALEAKVSERTKALLLNFPCNPTGATLTRDQMSEILDFCERHDIILLADEVYSELNYEIDDEADPPQVLPSFAGFPAHRDRVILLNGFSKSWAMTGYRLGYACGPEDIIDAMMKIHQYGIMSAPTLAQAAGVEAMDFGDKDVARMRREYKKRRDFLVPALNEMGLPTLMPKGAFYLFPDVRGTGLSSEDFCMKLLKEYKVACVPGGAFGKCGEGFIRISYATSLEKIKVAAKNMAGMVKACCGCAALALALAFAGCAPSQNEATATFVLDVNRSRTASSSELPVSYTEIVSTRLCEWRSAEVLDRAICEYRAASPASTIADEAIVQHLSSASIETEPGSRIITLRLSGKDAYLATALANAYLAAIEKYTADSNVRRSERATALIAANIAKMREEVNRASLAFLNFRTENNIEKMTAERDAAAQELRKANADGLAREAKVAADAERGRIAAKVLENPESVGECMDALRKMPGVDRHAKAYFDAAAAYAKLSVSFTENHPEVAAKKKELEDASRRLIDALRRVKASSAAEVSVNESAIASLKAKCAELRGTIEDLSRRMAQADAGLAKLKSDFDVKSKVLENLILDENKARIDADSNNEFVRIVNRARAKPAKRSVFGF